MDLEFDKLQINLIFELKVESDTNLDPRQVINIIADEIKIRKNYDGFSITGFAMDYEIRKNEGMIDV